MAFLGIDLGTSGLKALLVDGEGVPVGAATRAYPVSTPRPGWSEQDPADWIAALEDAVAELRASHWEFAAIRGIGVAGQMHGATLLDAEGRVIRPCILWNDTRSHAEAARLDAMPGVRAASGNIVFPGFTAPKLEWLRAHEPEAHARVSKVLLPAAFLNHYLTGAFVADLSDSSGTSWLDVGARDWSEMLLAAGHMRRDQMPGLVEGCAVAGTLRGEIVRRWGLSSAPVVAGGAGDNAAAACGIGAVRSGRGLVSLGTSGVVLVARDAFGPAPETAVHSFCHAVPGRWFQMGVMLAATDSLNWLAGIAGRPAAELASALGEVPGRPGRVGFLPYLSGERTPHNDPHVRASFTGLDRGTGVADLTRAVLEGVAFGMRDLAEALRGAGARPEALHLVGGGAASRYWGRLLATCLGLPLTRPRDPQNGVALGAARLGMVAATGAAPEDVMTAPEAEEVFEPVAEHAAAYDDAYRAFRAAYPASS